MTSYAATAISAIVRPMASEAVAAGRGVQHVNGVLAVDDPEVIHQGAVALFRPGFDTPLDHSRQVDAEEGEPRVRHTIDRAAHEVPPLRH